MPPLFMVVTDTLLEGLVPAEYEGEEPITYRTPAEAQAALEDWAQMAEDAGSTPAEDTVVACERRPDGSLVLADTDKQLWPV